MKKEQKQREQKEKVLEKFKKTQIKVKKKPWSWLTIEARKLVLELVSQIERKGRIKIGEQKKRDLLDRLRRKSSSEESHVHFHLEKKCEDDSFQSRVDGGIGHKYFTRQLLLIHLVGVCNSEAGYERKRSWSGRRGGWASWTSSGSPRRWLTGRRRRETMLSVDVESMETGEDHSPADDGHLHEDVNHTFSLEVEMAELMIPGDKIINIDKLTTQLNDLGLNKELLDVPVEGVGGRNGTPLKAGGRGEGEWEADANFWLTNFVLSIQHLELKSDLVGKLATIQKGHYKHFCFGDEIRAHQDLEKHLFKENISTHHILDYFDRDLITQHEPNRNRKCTSVHQCSLGREMPSPTVTVNKISPNPPPNISSRDSQEDSLCQDDRSQEGWMEMEDRSHEHQDNDIEMESIGKVTNDDFYNDSGTCNQSTWVRSDQGGKVKKQVEALNTKFDGVVDVDMVECRSVHMRVVEPGIARRMSLFEEQKDVFMEELDRPPEVKDKEVMLVDVTKESQTRKGLRKVVIARRKRKGQPREAGVAVTRIDDMFRESGSSPMVTNTLGGNVGHKRKQLGEEQGSMVVDRKRQRGF